VGTKHYNNKMHIEIRDNGSLSADTVQIALPNGEIFTASMNELCTFRLEELLPKLGHTIKVVDWAFEHDVAEFDNIKLGRQR
jgi:hypothetical protein